LANTARDDATQRIIDAQAIRDQAALGEAAAQALRDQTVLDQQTANLARLAAQQLAAQAVIDQTAADQAANANNVIAQNNIQQNIIEAVEIQTQQLKYQLAYREVGEKMAMAATKAFSDNELEDPEKHVKRFKLNVLAKKLPAAAADQLFVRFGYFG